MWDGGVRSAFCELCVFCESSVGRIAMVKYHRGTRYHFHEYCCDDVDAMIQWYHTGTSITRYHQGDDVGARNDPMVRWYRTSIIRYHQGDDDVGAMIRLYRAGTSITRYHRWYLLRPVGEHKMQL